MLFVQIIYRIILSSLFEKMKKVIFLLLISLLGVLSQEEPECPPLNTTCENCKDLPTTPFWVICGWAYYVYENNEPNVGPVGGCMSDYDYGRVINSYPTYKFIVNNHTGACNPDIPSPTEPPGEYNPMITYISIGVVVGVLIVVGCCVAGFCCGGGSAGGGGSGRTRDEESGTSRIELSERERNMREADFNAEIEYSRAANIATANAWGAQT